MHTLQIRSDSTASALFLRAVACGSVPRRIVLFGAGHQVREHAILLCRTMTTIEHCTIVNRRLTPRVDGLIRILENRFPHITFDSGTTKDDPSTETNVRQADIIMCGTASQTPLFPSLIVRICTRIILVGSYRPDMHEVDTILMRRAGKIVVDNRQSAKLEAGEIIDAAMKDEDLVELGHLLDEDTAEQARADVAAAGNVLIFKSASRLHEQYCRKLIPQVGIALQDVAIGNLVYCKAIEQGLGSFADLS